MVSLDFMNRILVVRNDKIGDFMLAWPALALLKTAGCHVTVLVPAYTASLAHLCPSVDDVILDPGSDAPASEQQRLLAQVRAGGFDGALALFSTWRVGMMLRRAGIAYRIAPATKLAQILYTRRITQRRSRSEKPEWVYNLDLAAVLLNDMGLAVGSVSAPYLSVPAADVSARRHRLAQQYGLPAHKPWLMVHAGSGGSANNLSISQYEALLVALSKRLPDWVVVLTAGPAEQAVVGQLMTALISQHVSVAMVVGRELADFVQDIAVADAFMAGSTGPLHIAGALDVPTIGFYPLRRSATALRWQTLNSSNKRLAISPDASMPDPERFDGLNIDGAAVRVSDWLREVHGSTSSA